MLSSKAIALSQDYFMCRKVDTNTRISDRWWFQKYLWDTGIHRILLVLNRFWSRYILLMNLYLWMANAREGRKIARGWSSQVLHTIAEKMKERNEELMLGSIISPEDRSQIPRISFIITLNWTRSRHLQEPNTFYFTTNALLYYFPYSHCNQKPIGSKNLKLGQLHMLKRWLNWVG